MDSAQQGLIDQHGRVATDLRVSLTDRCNLRCEYCMPAEGLDWLPSDETLTDVELIGLIGIAVEMLGVRDVRFTGGEPLLRRSLPKIVAETKALPSRPRTAMTSNGLGLKHMAKALAEAGLKPIKINAVLLRGINDGDAPELLRWCMDNDYELRFIEQMPLDAQHNWNREAMVTAGETLSLLGESLHSHSDGRPRFGAGGEVPDRRWTAYGRDHRFGHQAVLRQLQPRASHGRRSDPQLPFRP